MKILKTAVVAVAMGTVAFGASAPVVADGHGMSVEEAQEARVMDMKAMGGGMRGLGGLEGEAMIEGANLYIEAFGRMASLFPEGSGEGTKALPAIWQDFEGFEAVIAKGTTAAEAMLAAAEAGDMAAFGAAAQGLGPVCGECHQTYREARN